MVSVLMTRHHAKPGEIVDLLPLDPRLAHVKTTALIKASLNFRATRRSFSAEWAVTEVLITANYGREHANQNYVRGSVKYVLEERLKRPEQKQTAVVCRIGEVASAGFEMWSGLFCSSPENPLRYTSDHSKHE
jgi:hypothetical protein